MAEKKEEKKEKPVDSIPEEAPEAPKEEPPKEASPKKEEIEETPSEEVEIEYGSYEPEPPLDPKPSKHPRSFDPKGLFMGLFIAGIIVVVIFILMDKQDDAPITSPEQTLISNKTLIPVMYTYDNYFQNSAYFDGKTITLTGFLMHQQRPVGKAAYMQDYFVVDDYGTKITLSFTGMKNPDYFEPLFVKDGKTKDLFNVTGTFRMDNMYVVKLYVTTINPARREYISG